ncbi:MAG: excisionase family DNA-binding protein [Candidatus Sphingomonas phytovorans]|nr:excisionase family DNA-binding protein [Sphingomonas sp.]WEJ98372.1 MAG: excisionase family DNA-binding protein [Sphingomonas sp.]
MAEWALNMADIHAPSGAEIDAARAAAGQLSRLDRGDDIVSLRAGSGREAIMLPATIFRALLRMVAETGKGNAVAVVPFEAELTTQQAADLLNMSRPHLVKLLTRGELPYRMVGTHRKLPVRAVLDYRTARAAGQEPA